MTAVLKPKLPNLSAVFLRPQSTNRLFLRRSRSPLAFGRVLLTPDSYVSFTMLAWVCLPAASRIVSARNQAHLPLEQVRQSVGTVKRPPTEDRRARRLDDGKWALALG